jgi:hypothetical protein
LDAAPREVADLNYYRAQHLKGRGEIKGYYARNWHAGYRLGKAVETLTEIANDPTVPSDVQARTKARVEEIKEWDRLEFP